MNDLAAAYEAKMRRLAGTTLLVVMTFNDDGSVLMQYHGPAEPSMTRIVQACAGPCTVENLLPLEDALQHVTLPNGVLITHDDAT